MQKHTSLPLVGPMKQSSADRRRMRMNQQLSTDVLRLLNRGIGDLRVLIGEVLLLIQQSTGFDAVGLRMRQGDDCPYFEQSGFSNEFLVEENFLCRRGGDGDVIRNADGEAILECTCGLVMSGRTDPSMPGFTEGGSFWTNVSSELLALPPEDDPRVDPRNRCIHCGYQSVALVPVHSGDEIIGLLQLNGRAENMFTLEIVQFFEGLADNIGLALQRKEAEDALKVAYERVERVSDQLQQALMPRQGTLDLKGFSIEARYKPAWREAQVGGDFYDVFDLGSDRFAILIGDVVGKGIRAAIHVAAARHTVRSYAYLDASPAVVMTLTNKALCREAEDLSNMLTAFFAVVDVVERTITYASGGHEPPILCRAGAEPRELEITGPIIGIEPSFVYGDRSFELCSGDVIVMLTDGITEARHQHGELFGEKGVRNHLASIFPASARDVADSLLAAAIRHAEGTLHDDAAVVVLAVPASDHHK